MRPTRELTHHKKLSGYSTNLRRFPALGRRSPTGRMSVWAFAMTHFLDWASSTPIIAAVTKAMVWCAAELRGDLPDAPTPHELKHEVAFQLHRRVHCLNMEYF